MIIKDLLDIIPDILQYFVSGYIFIFLFTSITTKKIDQTISIIFSCVISFLWISFINVVIDNPSIWIVTSISCGLSILIAPLFGLIYRSNWFRNIAIKIFCQSPLSSIWDKVIDYKKGSNLKISLKDQQYFIIGHYDCHEKTEEDFWISLSAYIKVNSESKKTIVDFRKDPTKCIVLNSRDIETVEIF